MDRNAAVKAGYIAWMSEDLPVTGRKDNITVNLDTEKTTILRQYQ